MDSFRGKFLLEQSKYPDFLRLLPPIAHYQSCCHVMKDFSVSHLPVSSRRPSKEPVFNDLCLEYSQ